MQTRRFVAVCDITDALGMCCGLPVSMSPAQSLVSCLLAVLQRFAHLQQYACLCVGCIQLHLLLVQLDLQTVPAHCGSASRQLSANTPPPRHLLGPRARSAKHCLACRLHLSVVCVVSTCRHMALGAVLRGMRKHCRTEPMTVVPELLRI